MTTYYRPREQDFQKSETVTVRRTVLVEVGTSEAKTVTVSQAASVFTQSTSTATQLADALFVLTIATADLSTVGQLAFKLEGSTDTDYVFGMRVKEDDPYDDLHLAKQAQVGFVVWDSADASLTIKTDDGLTSLAKRIRTTSGTQTSWTPTTV